MSGFNCCFAMCNTNYKKSKRDGEKMRFFNFPSDPLTRKAWIKSCRQTPDFNPKYKRVCSLHFKVSDFEDEIQARLLNYPPKKLKKNAVPCLTMTSSVPETSSTSATSDKEKEYSKKLRKKVVEECLIQYKSIAKNPKSKLTAPIKGNNKVSEKNTRKKVTSPVKSKDKDSDKNIRKEVTVPIDESNKVSDKHIEKEVSVAIQNENEITDKNTEKEVNVPIEESIEISDKNTEEGTSAPITDEINVSDQNTRVVVVTVPIITTILQNSNENCVCGVYGVSQNCLKCQLRILKEENDALKSRIKVCMQNERDLKHTNDLAKKRIREIDAQFESKVKTAFQHFLSSNQVEAVLRKKMKVRWTDEEISKAFNIMQFSKRFYIYLKNTLNYPLPSLSTIKKWILDTSLKIEKDCSLEMVQDPPINLEILPSEYAMHSEYLSSDHPMDYEILPSDHTTHSENLATYHPLVGSENSKPEKESCHESSNPAGIQIKTLYFPSDSNTDPENPSNKKTSTFANKNFQFHVSHKNYFSKLILKRHRHKVVKPKRFTCSICQKGFDLNGALKRHFKTHVLENPWTCDVCDEIFCSKYYLDKHVTTHKNAEKFLCDICDQSFVKKVNFQDHYLKHKNIQPHIVCNKELNIDQCIIEGISNEQYGTDQFLVTHYPTQNEVKPYLCHICNELFENKSNLKIHLAVCKAESKSCAKDSPLTRHENSRHRRKVAKLKRFTCSICQKGFNLNGALKIHSKMHVLENPWTCDVCDEIFSSKYHLDKHVMTHKYAENFLCDICDQSFVKKVNFQYHYLKHKNIQPHNVNNKELTIDQCIIEGTSNEQYGTDQFLVTHYPTQTKVMPYLCHICNELFENKSDLKIHLVVCKAESKSCAKDGSLTKATYVCEFCNKGFRLRHFFQNHLLKHKNRQMIGKKFICEICDKTFAKQTTLHRHKILHDDDKNQVKFFCNVCSKGFRQKRYLNQHLQTHSDEKPYACVFCSKRFTQNSTLKKHFETHKNESYPSLSDLYG